MKNRYFRASGLILKRTNVGETDRVISVLTKERGKLLCVAKGVRKLKSSKRALLEPGNIIKGFFVQTKSWPLLAQATLIEDCRLMTPSLTNYRSLHLFLEIMEKIFVEDQLEVKVYNQVLLVRNHVLDPKIKNGQVRQKLDELIAQLGFRPPHQSKYVTISDYVAALTNSKLKSFEYLSAKKTN